MKTTPFLSTPELDRVNDELSVLPTPLTKLNVCVSPVSGSPADNVAIVVPVAVFSN